MFWFSDNDGFNGKFILKLPTDNRKSVYSENFMVKNRSWSVVVQQSDDPEFLDIYLKVFGGVVFSKSDSCLCFLLKIISNVGEQHSVVKKRIQDFKNGFCLGCGWSNAISWSRLKDPQYGYIKDGKITVQVDITAA